MDGYGDGPGWGGWIAMTLMMLAFWGLLVGGAFLVWRATRDSAPRTPAGPPEAERLLDERFARGEIDEEDYQRRRTLLRAGR